jgi:hypothetical protein
MLKQFFALFFCIMGPSISFAMIIPTRLGTLQTRLCTLPSGMVGNGLKIIKPHTVLPKTIKRNLDGAGTMLFVCAVLYTGCECAKRMAALQEKAATQEKLKHMADIQEKAAIREKWKRRAVIGDEYHLIDGVYVMVAKEYTSGMNERESTKYPLHLALENDQNLIKFVKDALVVDPLKSAVSNIVIFIVAPRIQPDMKNLNGVSTHVDLSELYANYVRVLIEKHIDDSTGVRIVCVSLPAEPCFS